jgi:hypothetical protein
MSSQAGKRNRQAAPSWQGDATTPLRLCATALIALIALGVSHPARAGAAPARYIYEVCDSALPGGGVTGVSYSQSAEEPWSPVDNCDQPGGSLSISQSSSITQGGSSTWVLPIEPPPGGKVESISISGAACENSGTSAYILNPGWPPSWCREEERFFHLPENFRTLDIELNCDGKCSGGAWVYGHYFAAVEVDPVAPTLTELSGALLDGDVQRGHQSLGAKAHDVGGGISSLSVLVNGLPAASPKVTNCNVAQTQNPSVSGTVAAQLTPCPADAAASWTLDTGTYPFRTGANAVQVCASDFATLSDPNTACSAPQTVAVDDSCTESPVPGGDNLSAQFAQSNADAITVGFGQSAAVTGQLKTNAGDPVPGATLCVKMQTLEVDSRANPVDTVKTDANGDYAYQVPPGPNREVVIGYRHDASQVARDVRYYAHAGPSLHSSPAAIRNGDRVHFWGQLPGPSPRGRVVVLQANVVGSKRWITFRKATSDSQGIFRTAYHFIATFQATTYRFRAVVPVQVGYPWAQGQSKPVRVLVRP